MQTYKLFVSSPSDVMVERRRVENVVSRLNGEFASTDGEFLPPAVRDEGTYVLFSSNGSSDRIWRIFPATQELVDHAKPIVPRCLTPQQRKDFFLDPEPPAWCVTLEKWPYHTQDWKHWLNYKPKSASPPLPDTLEWQTWVAARKAK